MSLFITRVELHNGEQDYDALHRAMAAEKFSRTILYYGVTYHLPTAEYSSTAADANIVLQAARRAVAATRKTAGILVTLSSLTVPDGLPVVR